MSKLPDPEWPEEPENMVKAIEIAFKDRFIDDHGHPTLKETQRGALMLPLPFFDRIYVVDFEFIAKPSEHPIPVCVVSHK